MSNMKYTLIDSYKNTKLVPKDIKEDENRISITFLGGPKVEVVGNAAGEYEVDFIDLDKSTVVHASRISTNMWTAANIKYYVNWQVNVKRDGVVVAQETFNVAGKKVKIVLDTQSIGDLIAYIGAVDHFQKTHNCKVTCVVFQPELFAIFKNSYTNIEFSNINEGDAYYYAIYTLGWFDDWVGNAPQNPQTISIANIGSNILGFYRLDFKPTLKFKRKKNYGKKYVCIGLQSTAQFKYWNNPTGWDEVVAHLNKLGYDVWCIDRFNAFGGTEKMNYMPKGCIDKTGDTKLEQRLEQLSGADFFIGLSSGLSWMAWAVGIPVVLISGIGERWTEFFTPHRVINKRVCHACTNDTSTRFEKNNWMYCPRQKNFECTVKISGQMVIDEIDKLQTDFYRKTMHNLDWGPHNTTGDKELLFRETYLDKTYERFFTVDEGDVVMDIGAHVGVVTLAMLQRKPKKIIAVEPNVIRIKHLKNNTAGYPVTIINAGLGTKKETIKDGLDYDGVREDFPLLPMSDIMAQAGIEQIDHLKIDCEGGEYNLFTAENFDWISKNVKKIVGELHLEDAAKDAAFRKFRDTYLAKLDVNSYEIYSIDGVNIKWDLFNEHFIEWYEEVIFIIDNRATFEPKEPRGVAGETGVTGSTGVSPSTRSLAVTDRQSQPLITNPDFYDNIFGLDGKVAIVTGAGGHLGAAMVMGLVSHGATVYAFGRDVDKIVAKLHTPENSLKDMIIPMACDVTNESDIARCLNYIGQVDILINNAFSEKRKPFEELTQSDWNEGMNNILTQQFLCCKAIAPRMALVGGGSIINIASIYGMIGIDQRAYQIVPSSTVFYTAAKAASIQLTKELAVQYAAKGIRVNSISPGHFPKPPADPSKANPAYVEGLADMVPMKRVGCADELAGAAVYLASDASSYVTGHNLVVDGGRTIW